MNPEHFPNPRRAAAGHLNGILAKGRKSAEGRARSAQNAIKHHLSAKNFFLLPTENAQTYAEMSSALEDTFAPQDPFEHTIVGEIIACEWKLARIEALEATALSLECERILKSPSQVPRSNYVPDCDHVLWLAYENLESNAAFKQLSRYRAQCERTRNRALKNLELYRAMPKLPPIELEPEETEITTANQPIPFPQPTADPKPESDKTKVTDPYPLL